MLASGKVNDLDDWLFKWHGYEYIGGKDGKGEEERGTDFSGVCGVTKIICQP
jgi:hypothetical protein